MRHVRVLLLILGLMVLAAAGCGGEDGASGHDGNGSEEAATEGTQAFAGEREVQASTDAASGGRVETCDGGSIRLNAAEERLL